MRTSTTHGRKFQASRSIKYLAAQMEPFGFFRCHDSFVVNLQEIEQYTAVVEVRCACRARTSPSRATEKNC